MDKNIKQWLFKLKYLLAFGVFALCTGFVGEDCIVNRIAKRQEIARLKEEIAKKEEQFKEDNERLYRLKTDREAIKEVARERYFMKTENEDIFIIEY